MNDTLESGFVNINHDDSIFTKSENFYCNSKASSSQDRLESSRHNGLSRSESEIDFFMELSPEAFMNTRFNAEDLFIFLWGMFRKIRNHVENLNEEKHKQWITHQIDILNTILMNHSNMFVKYGTKTVDGVMYIKRKIDKKKRKCKHRVESLTNGTQDGSPHKNKEIDFDHNTRVEENDSVLVEKSITENKDSDYSHNTEIENNEPAENVIQLKQVEKPTTDENTIEIKNKESEYREKQGLNIIENEEPDCSHNIIKIQLQVEKPTTNENKIEIKNKESESRQGLDIVENEEPDCSHNIKIKKNNSKLEKRQSQRLKDMKERDVIYCDKLSLVSIKIATVLSRPIDCASTNTPLKESKNSGRKASVKKRKYSKSILSRSGSSLLPKKKTKISTMSNKKKVKEGSKIFSLEGSQIEEELNFE